MQTGYFYHYPKNAGPSGHGVSTKVHLEEDGKPVCGAKLHKDSQFSFAASGIHLPYLECKRCKKIATEMFKAA